MFLKHDGLIYDLSSFLHKRNHKCNSSHTPTIVLSYNTHAWIRWAWHWILCNYINFPYLPTSPFQEDFSSKLHSSVQKRKRSLCQHVPCLTHHVFTYTSFLFIRETFDLMWPRHNLSHGALICTPIWPSWQMKDANRVCL